jgi:hypothetical protein
MLFGSEDNVSTEVQQEQNKNRAGLCFYKSATRAEQKQGRTMFLQKCNKGRIKTGQDYVFTKVQQQ